MPAQRAFQKLGTDLYLIISDRNYTKHVILVLWTHAGRRGATDTGIQCIRSWVYEHKNAFT